VTSRATNSPSRSQATPIHTRIRFPTNQSTGNSPRYGALSNMKMTQSLSVMGTTTASSNARMSVVVDGTTVHAILPLKQLRATGRKHIARVETSF